MGLPEEFDRVTAFLSGRVWFILAYRINATGRSDSLLEFYRGASSFDEKGSQLAPRYESTALRCYQQMKDGIIEPLATSPIDRFGRQWWGFIVTTGAVRKAGIVIVATILACNSAEVTDCIKGVQRIMGAAGENPAREGFDSNPFVVVLGDSTLMPEPPLDPWWSKDAPRWITADGEDRLAECEKDPASISETLAKLKSFLFQRPFKFCVIYGLSPTGCDSGFKWCRAVSPYFTSQAEYEKLAARYQEIALSSYQWRRDFIFKESLPSSNTRKRHWRGQELLIGETSPAAANSQGQRWYRAVVGTGAVREAGFSMVIRIAAKDRKEMHDFIGALQNIMSTYKGHTQQTDHFTQPKSSLLEYTTRLPQRRLVSTAFWIFIGLAGMMAFFTSIRLLPDRWPSADKTDLATIAILFSLGTICVFFAVRELVRE